MKVYFIGGLGCNSYYPQDFCDELPFSVTYLDLYRQDLENVLTSVEKLKTWFEREVDLLEEIFLIAHSLGAHFAVFLATAYEQVTRLLLLDGGFFDMEQICSLDQEVAAALDYLQTSQFESLEEAVLDEKNSSPRWSEHLAQAARENWVFDDEEKVWKLAISEKLVKNLLTLRRDCTRELSLLQNKTVLLVVPKMKGDMPTWRKLALDSLPTFVQCLQLENCGHSLYTEVPHELAQLLKDELKNTARSMFFD